MGFYERSVLPRIIDKVCGNEDMQQVRAPTVAGVHGVVLEIGFGSGPNLPVYPDGVTRILAVDPSELGQRLAARRLAASPIPVSFVGLDGERLDLDDDSVDSALSTWTLCTIPDAETAVREIGRVLKPGGELFFLEHGLSEDPKIARRQHRFTPVQRKIAGGCHLDRDIDAILRAGGMDVKKLKKFQIAGPKSMSFMYAGYAVPREGA